MSDNENTTPRQQIGRPTDYSLELAAEICARLVNGDSLRKICIADDMPCIATIYVWFSKHSEFVEQYARAREDQADTLADEIIDIADDKTGDTIVDKDGNERADTEWINRSRLRVDARKWVASKLKPKKYGDSMTHKGDAAEPISVNISLG